MERDHVESSNLKSVGYDISQVILEVEFHHGAIWQYSDVMESTYHEMMSAASIGTYFNANIKGKYPENRVR